MKAMMGTAASSIVVAAVCASAQSPATVGYQERTTRAAHRSLHGGAGVGAGQLRRGGRGRLQRRLRRDARDRALDDMVMAGDTGGLFNRFASQTTITRTCESLGERVFERAFPYPTPVRTYVAEHRAGDGTCKVEIDFTGWAHISSLQVIPRPVIPPDPSAGYRSDLVFQLPFTGTWLVAWGSHSLSLNYHIATPNQTYAYDIVVWKRRSRPGFRRGRPVAALRRRAGHWRSGAASLSRR